MCVEWKERNEWVMIEFVQVLRLESRCVYIAAKCVGCWRDVLCFIALYRIAGMIGGVKLAGITVEKKRGGESHIFWMWNTSWRTVDMNECEVKRGGRDRNKYWANCVKGGLLFQRVFLFTTMFSPVPPFVSRWIPTLPDTITPHPYLPPLWKNALHWFSVLLCGLYYFSQKKNKNTHNSRPST
jgi:hypothetical protein